MDTDMRTNNMRDAGRSGFLVQLHLHTSETSACGESGGAEMARACKAAGYGAIVVTDHFMNANIGCPRRARWEDKVEYLFRGYRAAKAEGDRIGLAVFKGWETFTQGREFLTYGLDEAFLLANPDIADVGVREYLSRVEAAGGWVVHAHPFRKADYIPDFAPDPSSVEAFEVFNAGNGDPAWNEEARAMAAAHGLIEIAGADAHSVDQVRSGAMRLPLPILTLPELVASLRSREGAIVEFFGADPFCGRA
jgi:predicted metal-dependent phosphoesterase TrpH